MQGLIIKAISGDYFIKSQDKIYECKAKGVFRYKDISPLVGDIVDFEDNVITNISKRKNSFLRPPLANLDKLFIIISTCQPSPNYFVIDKLLAVCEYKEIIPILIVTKTDIEENNQVFNIYKNSGFKVLYNNEIDLIKPELSNCISAFIGNTGVGKSTLLNNLFPDLQLETSQISKKLGRGKHTTRHIQLFPIDNGYVADTPGFGTLDVMQYDIILKDQLQYCFHDFSNYIDKCTFTGCSHTCEKGCCVIKALEEGKIEKSRFESYVELYNQAKNIKEWEINSKGKLK
ncbi:MAG: ribosome small subunit-dependent GTPase A [Oscillospiraceae bacterium]